MRIADEETGGNPCCSTAPEDNPQASRIWSGPPVVLQQRGLTVGRKTKKQKEIASTSTKRKSTQRPHLKGTNYKDHRQIKPLRWEETSAKG